MSATARNPGPDWGFALIRSVDRILPDWIMAGLLALGAVVAVCLMPRQRRGSRAFLTKALERQATVRDVWRHFYAFAWFLVERFRVAHGKDPEFRASDSSEDRIETLTRDRKQALYGSFHFGQSDLMGFWLSRFDLSVRMVRFQVGNSADLEWLDRRFGKTVSFIWVNEPAEMLFALKAAIDEGHSIAMKCDRTEHSAKLETFTFLGDPHRFPFTIYHLAILFALPVVYAFGVRGADGAIEVYSSTIFRPTAASKSANLAAARIHFEATLSRLEGLVRRYPYQWFNFVEAPEDGAELAEARTSYGRA